MPTRRQMASDEEFRLSNGKENSAGRSVVSNSEILCPESTSTAVAIVEQPELRAYKLGKQKCSYNQVELVIKDISGGMMSELRVSEAIETIVGSEVEERLRESCLKFHVRFVNNARIQLYIYVVYSSPYGTTKPDKHTVLYHWMPVTRSKCRKGCTGPVIRGLQRFGRMPRRGAAAVDGEDTWKEPRHLYIAIDEASTHVCPRHETSKFRLLVAAYDDNNQLLGTTISSSIRVLANNDAPLGAASFKLHCHLKGVLKGSSPSRSSRHQLGDSSVLVQSRLPLQALPPNTSPSRSKTTSEEVLKSESAASTETAISLPSTRRESPNKQVVAVRGAEQRKSVASEGQVHSDMNEHVVAQVTERILEDCSVKPVKSIISLRTLARIVGAKRGVVTEIFGVLQSVGVVQPHEKEKFRWLGSSSIMSTLTKLSKEVNPFAKRKSLAQSAGLRFGPNTFLTQQRAFRQDQTLDNLMCGLSKRLIRLFLMDVTTPVSWDRVLTVFLDNHPEKDAEENRSIGRRLMEILRVFGTLQLVKRCTPIRYSASTTYHWVGADAAINYLNRLSAGSTTQSEGIGVSSHYLRSSKHPSARKQRDLTSESAYVCHQHDDMCTDNSIECSQQHSTVPDKMKNEGDLLRRSKRRFSDTNNDESQPFFASGCQKVPTYKSFSTRTSIPKRPRLFVSTLQATTVSDIIQDDSTCSGVDGAHFSQRTTSQEQVSCELLDPRVDDEIAQGAPDGSAEQRMSGEACRNFKYPLGAACISSRATDEAAAAERSMNGSRAIFDSKSMDQLSKPGADTNKSCDQEAAAYNAHSGADPVFSAEYGSGPSVFQFPYKKRPHNWSSFLTVATQRCFDQQLSIEYTHPGYFMDLTVDQSELPCNFKPLYYLQQLLTPQQVEHITAQNPAFLFHYVHYFRVIYHSLSTGKGTTPDQAVVRPVAEHGAVEMPSHLFARKRDGSSSSALPPASSTLHHLLIPGGPWQKKDLKPACADSDQTSCDSPNSTHHDVHTAAQLLDR